MLHDFFPPDWEGILQSDGARMYPGALKHRPTITHFECAMHMRRKVNDACVANEPEALPLLKEITRLYRLETLADRMQLNPVQSGGHPNGGWRSAVIYSVIGTCRLNGVNPAAYMRWVLPKLAARRAKERDDFDAKDLLPQDFARLHRTSELPDRSRSPEPELPVTFRDRGASAE